MKNYGLLFAFVFLFIVVSGKGDCIAQSDSVKKIEPQKQAAIQGQENKVSIAKGVFSDNIFAEMVYVEGGTFTMGCTEEQSDCWDNEKITHPVTLGNFYINKYELTVKQFALFINESGYKTDAEKLGWSYIWKGSAWAKIDNANWKCDVSGNIRDTSGYNHPVIHLSWNDAKGYCIWLSKKTGKKYRLPTEAEWEYAARGGLLAKTEPAYKFAGSDKPGSAGWFVDNSDSTTHPVGEKSANALGLFDMSGNVWEWCSDWFEDYKAGALINPKGPAKGTNKVLRGGSWLSFYWSMRVSNRSDYNPANTCTVNGFRIAMDGN